MNWRLLRSNRGLVLAALALGAELLSCDGKLVLLGQAPGSSAANMGGASSTNAGATNAGGTGAGAGRPSSPAGGQTNGAGQSNGAGSGNSAAGTSNSAGAAGQLGGAANPTPTVLEPKFTSIAPVPSLASEYEDDNPTLTADLKELYFTSKNRPGGKGNVDVWVAKRSSDTGDFDEPIPVLEVSTVGIDNSPAIAADGLTIWVGFAPATDGLGGYDIMQATRASRSDAFGSPVLVRELSSAKDDIPRPLGNHNLTMPLASRRDSEIYLTYFATRSGLTTPFGAPMIANELIVQGANVSDAFLTDDGLTLYFARSVEGLSDLFVTRRTTISSPFVTAVPLTTINTDDDERDPWLTPDGKHLYFSSDRKSPGTLNIYEAVLLSN